MATLIGAESRPTQPQEMQQKRSFKDWFDAFEKRAAPYFVGITLLAIIAGSIAMNNAAPDWTIALFGVTAFIAGGLFGAKGALESLLERRIDVDMLMVLAALGAASIGEWTEGAVLLFLFSLSNVLQEYAIGRSRKAIQSLFKLYPTEAKVRREGEVKTVQIGDIRIGEVVLIEPGERIPVDGVVHAGRSAVDQAPITGESMPVEKTVGDKVFAGTLNKQGLLDVQATAQAQDTTLARVIRMVEEAQDSKAPTERFLDTFEQFYAAAIIVGVLLFTFVPPLLGIVDNFSAHFYTAMVLMTVASPCALVISVPASFISAIASAARGGVLFKGGAYLEQMASIKVIAFDKTGTLTRGEPTVTDTISCCELGENELLSVAGAVEARSEHPLAKAVVRAAEARGVDFGTVQDFEALPGQGVLSKVDGKQVKLGSLKYLREKHPMPAPLEAIALDLESKGRTVIGVIREGHCEDCAGCELSENANPDWMGIIGIADELRDESAQVVQRLHARGIQVAMLTGDNERVARHIAAEAGVDRVFADLMPADKVRVVQQLAREIGPVAMIGDGVNDAPALATAQIGVAMGAAGTDVALETADLVLMGDKLELIPYAISLSQKARRVVWQNIVFSLLVIVLLVISVFAVGLALPLGVLGHEGSTVIVVLNGLIQLLLLPEIARRRQSAPAV